MSSSQADICERCHASRDILGGYMRRRFRPLQQLAQLDMEGVLAPLQTCSSSLREFPQGEDQDDAG